jgi:hypothetical protein
LLFFIGCNRERDSHIDQPPTTRSEQEDDRTLGVVSHDGRLKVYTRPVGFNKLELILDGAPEFVHALEMAPKAREPELDRGTWLVLVFAVVSVPDTRCILTAVSSGEELKRIEVGLRPFADYDDTKTWYGEYGSIESPLWLVMRNGKVLGSKKGVHSKVEILDFIKGALALD